MSQCDSRVNGAGNVIDYSYVKSLIDTNAVHAQALLARTHVHPVNNSNDSFTVPLSIVNPHPRASAMEKLASTANRKWRKKRGRDPPGRRSRPRSVLAPLRNAAADH